MSRPSPGRDSNSPHIAPPPNFSLSHSPSRPESTSYSRGQHTTEIRDLSSCAGYIVQATPTHSPVHPHPMSEPMLHDVAMESPVRDESGRRGSPSSSSQGELGDSDMDSGPSSQQDHTTGQTSNQQVKKKRTRTLTTPHQSAVLHALLAQSRFPTTAMREEVGRQIGLSARKVQIWFQNQRQKARRPQGQNTAPQRLDRPPQFGPFPSVPMPVHQEGSQGSASEPVGASWHHPQSIGLAEPLSRHPTSGAVLGGLVIPDPQYTLQTSSPTERSSVYAASSRIVPPSPTTRYPLDVSLREGGRLHRELDEDTSLPPFQSDLRTSSGLPALPFIMGSERGTLRLPRVTTNPSLGMQGLDVPASTTIPPPFTLEPPPQWQRDPVLPVGRAWRGSNLSGLHRPYMLTHGRSSSERVRQSRNDRRFDPIRSSWIDEPSTSKPHNPDSKDQRRNQD